MLPSISSPREGRKVQSSIKSFFSEPDSSRNANSSLKPKAPLASSADVEQRALLPALTVVWAKFSTYPPWPALVCPDPAEGRHISSNGRDVHVQFFDESSSHAWVEVRTDDRYHRYV